MSNILIKSGNKYIFKHSDISYYSTVKNLINGVELEKSFKDGWYCSDSKPTKLTVITQEKAKDKWVLKKDYENLPLAKERPEDYFNHDEDNEYPQESLFYSIVYKDHEKRKDIDLEFDHYYEEDIKEPAYFSVSNNNYSNPQILKVTGSPSMAHAVLYPEIMHASRPTAISGDKLYEIVRQHVKTHIDSNYARITSDYDFCFTVKKQIGIEPEHRTKDTRTGRQRKPRLVSYVVKDRDVQIFEMTTPSRKYSGYTPIAGISAKNHEELKEKIESFLDNLMEQINEPLETCRQCNGDGVVSVKNNG